MPAGRRVGLTQRSTTDATHSTESPRSANGSLPLGSPVTGETATSRGSPCVGSSNFRLLSFSKMFIINFYLFDY
jgi:hypothetical protein